MCVGARSVPLPSAAAARDKPATFVRREVDPPTQTLRGRVSLTSSSLAGSKSGNMAPLSMSKLLVVKVVPLDEYVCGRALYPASARECARFRDDDDDDDNDEGPTAPGPTAAEREPSSWKDVAGRRLPSPSRSREFALMFMLDLDRRRGNRCCERFCRCCC